MSTTITYKGNTLATVSNNTKTLKTAGKYMEGDVTLTDVSSTIVVSETYDTNGGIIKTITTTGDTTNLQAKIVTPSNARQTINPDTGYVGMSQVVVEAASGTTINNQNKSVTPSESQQSITADSGYTGLGTVTVSAISSTYVGSGITRRSSSDLTASGATVSVPAGYYSAAASKSVASGSVGFPVAIKGTPARGEMRISPSVTTTTGYIIGDTIVGDTVLVDASELVVGTYTVDNSGTIDVTYYESISVPSGSATAPASISGTAASVSTGTNTLTLTKTVSVTPTVTAGYVSSGTAGNSSVSLTANVTTKAAATITPGTTNQTIASGTYLTGTQTIAGDADLVASNIISTANIFGVQGSVVLQTYYTGSSAPASSLGANGDIYIQS